MFNRARGTIAAIAAVLGLGTGSAVWATAAASAAPSSIPPVCTTANLVVWVNVDQGQGALGTWYYPLEFTNVSNHACRVWGYPGVSATDAIGKQLGDAAGRQADWPPAWVNIGAGRTVHALFGYAAAKVSTASCKPQTATYLKVYPPDQTTARHAFFDLPSCTLPHHTYLFVSVIRPGSAI
jgi:uncharacterized protein DUF4232